MGNKVSQAVEAAQKQAEANEKQTLADLKNLNEVLTAKAEEYFVKLINNKGEDKTIPIKTVIEYKKHVSCSVSNTPSQKLNDAVEEMFGGNFMSSLKVMALGAIDGVLGNTTAGSKEETGYKVLLLNNTIVRVDYYVYGFNMHTAALKDRTQNGLAFVSVVGVVDMKQVGIEALVYLVGAQANQAKSFMDRRTEEWKQRYQRLQGLDALLKTKDFATTAGSYAKLAAFPSLGEIRGWLIEADLENDHLEAHMSANERAGYEEQEAATQSALTAAASKMATFSEEKEWFDAKKAPDGKTVPTEAQLVASYVAVYTELGEAAKTAVSKIIRDSDNLLTAMTKEQVQILDNMITVYKKAREVATAYNGS